jgi:hypothetical protein
MNARDHNRDKVLEKKVSKRSIDQRSELRDRTCFWRTVAVKLAFRDKRESPEYNTVNQLSDKDQKSISNLSHPRWAPSDAYFRGECKFQSNSIDAYRQSIVQYLPKKVVQLH